MSAIWVKDTEGNFINLSHLAIIRRFRTQDGLYRVFGYANADDPNPCVVLHEVKTEQEISIVMFEISTLVSISKIEVAEAH